MTVAVFSSRSIYSYNSECCQVWVTVTSSGGTLLLFVAPGISPHSACKQQLLVATTGAAGFEWRCQLPHYCGCSQYGAVLLVMKMRMS